MVQSAENWFRQNAPDGLNSPRHWCILVQRSMCASFIIILHVREEDVAHVSCAEDDDMIKTLPSDRSDQSFSMSILPRRSQRSWPVTNAHRTKTPFEILAVDAVAITDEVFRCGFPAAGLGQLARDPFGGRGRCHSQPHNPATAVSENQQSIEQTAGVLIPVQAAPYTEVVEVGTIGPPCRGRALSHCRTNEAKSLRLAYFQAATTAVRHAFIADARNARCVWADVRWRWTLKVL